MLHVKCNSTNQWLHTMTGMDVSMVSMDTGCHPTSKFVVHVYWKTEDDLALDEVTFVGLCA